MKQERYLALDVFRGVTICFMIIVNSPGTWDIAYGPLLHASWHGFTPTDLVFPSFLFAVGNAMAFSLPKYASQGDGIFWRKTLKRAVIIFILGVLMYLFPFVDSTASGISLKSLADARVPGVLQRIALCYLIASVVLHYGSRQVALAFCALALLGYWILSYAFGAPGDPYSLTGNAVLRMDLFLLGESHLYHGEGIAFDPEGLLSTLPAIVNVMIGFFVGDFIRKRGNNYETIAKLMIAGAVCTFFAYAWDLAFPINKKLWTSSFVLLTVGLDMVILSLLIYVVEVRKQQRWTPFFLVFGRNPLFIYLLSEVLLITLYLIPVGGTTLQQSIYQDVLLKMASPVNASLIFAVLFMLTCWAVGYWLDKKKIYIKV